MLDTGDSLSKKFELPTKTLEIPAMSEEELKAKMAEKETKEAGEVKTDDDKLSSN
jgi:hypothetical protein